jgi:hypothetical protein
MRSPSLVSWREVRGMILRLRGVARARARSGHLAVSRIRSETAGCL